MTAHDTMMQSKIGGCDCSFVCYMGYTEAQIKEWLLRRFGSYSNTYYVVWLTRFKSGSAYKFMDDESRNTWREVRLKWLESNCQSSQ